PSAHGAAARGLRESRPAAGQRQLRLPVIPNVRVASLPGLIGPPVEPRVRRRPGPLRASGGMNLGGGALKVCGRIPNSVRAGLGERLGYLREIRASGRLIWPAGMRVVPFTSVPVTVRVPACQQSARRWSTGPDTGGCAAGRVDFSSFAIARLWTADSERC